MSKTKRLFRQISVDLLNMQRQRHKAIDCVMIKMPLHTVSDQQELAMKTFISRFIPISIAFALFLLASPVYAADIAVSADCSLADAITAANTDTAANGCPAGEDADIISLSADLTLDAALPPITSEITIEGGGHTISGSNRYRIFVVEGGNLTINHLILTAGKASNKGSPVVDHDRNLIISADNALGGAILNDGTLTISSSDFSNNSADYMGGAILNNGTLTISSSTFSDNSADERGGAVYNWRGQTSISSTTFTGNSADERGGAVYNMGNITISSSDFRNNSTGNDGGAVYNMGNITISSSAFSNNAADYDGGAIYNERGTLTISDSALSDNAADRSGGAMLNWGGETSINNSSFSGNSARGRDIGGGAIYNEKTLTISNSSFSNNSARVVGGAIHNENTLTISNSSFSGNSARYGGGLFVSDNANFQISQSRNTLTQVTLVDNSADSGGGIYGTARTLGYFDYVESTVNLYNSIVARNSGGDCVGELTANFNNLIQDGSCSPALSGDPLLGALVEPEDGSTAHYPPMAYSPAVGAANERYCPATDQVGTARPQGSACNIGAIEYTTTIEPENRIITIVSTTSLNVRRGPSTNYGVVDGFQRGEEAVAIGRNADGSWVQMNTGWVFAQLVEARGSIRILPVTSE